MLLSVILVLASLSGGADRTPDPESRSSRDSIRIQDSREVPAIVTKNPTGALVRSAILPGWGQFYNHRPVKGLVLGSIELGLLGWLISEHIASENARNAEDDPAYQFHSQRRLDLIWYTSAAWLFGMLDAYVDAYLYPFSTENEVFERETGIGAAIYINL
ncbi:MAG: hypothetical protein R6U39_03840 [Candidatus Aegiribacteria sp.]